MLRGLCTAVRDTILWPWHKVAALDIAPATNLFLTQS